jgi:hypothetical protein
VRAVPRFGKPSDGIVADLSETAVGKYMDVDELDVDVAHDDDLATGSARIASHRAVANTPTLRSSMS